MDVHVLHVGQKYKVTLNMTYQQDQGHSRLTCGTTRWGTQLIWYITCSKYFISYSNCVCVYHISDYSTALNCTCCMYHVLNYYTHWKMKPIWISPFKVDVLLHCIYVVTFCAPRSILWCSRALIHTYLSTYIIGLNIPVLHVSCV